MLGECLVICPSFTAGQLGVVWVIFGAFGARKGDKTSRGAGCEPYSSRPPAVEGSFDVAPRALLEGFRQP